MNRQSGSNDSKWAAFYCRLSRDDDNEGDSNSIQHQKQILERYARDHGITQYRYYVDDGYTGTNFNRPGFKEMLADIEAGHVMSVIVKDMSRFGRNYLEVRMYTEIRFPELNVRFIAINDGVDSDRDDSDFTPFRNIINEWYAKDTSKKIRAVFRAKGESGKRVSSKVPYGYLLGEDGKLVVDEETAPVVQMIFKLCAEGNGTGVIARILRERKINTPSTTEFLRTGKSQYYRADEPCGWCATTIGAMLEHKEYLGHTVNFKTYSRSFKNKRRLATPEDQQIIFENTHEPIISTEVWELVQRNRQQRRRPTKAGGIALFSGLLFCADCGSRLTARRIVYHGVEGKAYICSKYRSDHGKHHCTMHHIREDDLTQLVLENLRKIISYARDYEEAFVQQVMEKSLAEQMRQQAAAKRTLAQQTRRIGELDTLIQQLYENMVKGVLTAERFAKLSAGYEQEQKEREAKAAELKDVIEAGEAQQVNVKSFLRLVRSYIEPEQLTPEVLRTFVEKIIVHDSDWSGKHRTQQIDIHYNFVGEFDLSVETVRAHRRKYKNLTGDAPLAQQAV